MGTRLMAWNGKLKEKYADLTDDDLAYEEGKDEQFWVRIAQKTGKTKDDIENWVRYYWQGLEKRTNEYHDAFIIIFQFLRVFHLLINKVKLFAKGLHSKVYMQGDLYSYSRN